MSQEVAIWNAARTTYGHLLPHLRRHLGPAAAVFLGTVAGGVFLGPLGTVPGAVSGATLSVYAEQILTFFTIAVNFIMENPTLVASMWTVIGMLRDYLRNSNQPDRVRDRPHPH